MVQGNTRGTLPIWRMNKVGYRISKCWLCYGMTCLVWQAMACNHIWQKLLTNKVLFYVFNSNLFLIILISLLKKYSTDKGKLWVELVWTSKSWKGIKNKSLKSVVWYNQISLFSCFYQSSSSSLAVTLATWGFDSVHDCTRFKNKCTNCTLPCGLFLTYRRKNRINFTCIIICTYIIGLATFILLYMASITLQPTCIMAHATVYWPHKLNSHWLNVHGSLHHFLPRELLHLAQDLFGTNSHNMDCVTLNKCGYIVKKHNLYIFRGLGGNSPYNGENF
jgi:hypothetical protein